jgi:hypothetical protein
LYCLTIVESAKVKKNRRKDLIAGLETEHKLKHVATDDKSSPKLPSEIGDVVPESEKEPTKDRVDNEEKGSVVTSTYFRAQF